MNSINKTNDSSSSRTTTLQAVSSFTIQVRRLVEGLLGGTHPSVHFGSSVEFAEHKKYNPGDDIRRIDWNALARTDKYFVKQQQREVILNALFVVDCSNSMGYCGSKAVMSKLSYAAELTAAVSYIILHQGDAAGLLTFSQSTKLHASPGRNPGQLALLMNRFSSLVPIPEEKTGYAEAVSKAAALVGKRAFIVLATDLWGATEDTQSALTRLAAHGHDISIIQVLDPDELNLPFSQPVNLAGMEGEGSMYVNPSLIREDYRIAAKEFIDSWRLFCGRHGIDFMTVTTDRSTSSVLSEFVSRRHRRRRLK